MKKLLLGVLILMTLSACTKKQAIHLKNEDGGKGTLLIEISEQSEKTPFGKRKSFKILPILDYGPHYQLWNDLYYTIKTKGGDWLEPRKLIWLGGGKLYNKSSYDSKDDMRGEYIDDFLDGDYNFIDFDSLQIVLYGPLIISEYNKSRERNYYENTNGLDYWNDKLKINQWDFISYKDAEKKYRK